MKNRLSYQDFLRRQKLAEEDYLSAEHTWLKDIGYIKGQGVKKTILNEIKEQVAPPGSLLARFINPSKQEQRYKKTLFGKLMGRSKSPKQSTYSSLTQDSKDPETGSSSDSRPHWIISTGIALAKPILWAIGIGMIKGFLRKKFKPLRFILR